VVIYNIFPAVPFRFPWLNIWHLRFFVLASNYQIFLFSTKYHHAIHPSLALSTRPSKRAEEADDPSVVDDSVNAEEDIDAV